MTYNLKYNFSFAICDCIILRAGDIDVMPALSTHIVIPSVIRISE